MERDKAEIPPALLDPIRDCMYGRAPWPLVLIGPAGTGKTCAALCVSDYTLGGREYNTAEQLPLDLVEASKANLFTADGRERVTVKGYWKRWRSVEIAILDELGARSYPSDWHYICCKSAIDHREGKPLIVICNCDLDAIYSIYDERVASRLAAGTVVRVEGEDRRVRQ